MTTYFNFFFFFPSFFFFYLLSISQSSLLTKYRIVDSPKALTRKTLFYRISYHRRVDLNTRSFPFFRQAFFLQPFFWHPSSSKKVKIKPYIAQACNAKSFVRYTHFGNYFAPTSIISYFTGRKTEFH